ncbi:hypothetical protein P245_20925 [Comamonas thiooxydans]|uniref:Uncharacterized protein n=2 Tax=Comamonas thiooxydans TaxID=363952 RepID=A0A0E3BG05_9BURK|nr:hypothetical protein P245_20925 [Comamonas thiooxydans]
MGLSMLPLVWISGERMFINGNFEFGVVALFVTTILAFFVMSALAVYIIRSHGDASKKVAKSI